MTNPTPLQAAIEKLSVDYSYSDACTCQHCIVLRAVKQLDGLQDAFINQHEQLSALQAKNEGLKAQWKEYCGEYDLMLARWKDEKADIAKRCGYPWEFGIGLEPWVAADELRNERDSLKSALKSVTKERDDMENELAGNALLLLSLQTQRDEAKELLESARNDKARMRGMLQRIATQFPDDGPDDINVLARHKCEQAKNALSSTQTPSADSRDAK